MRARNQHNQFFFGPPNLSVNLFLGGATPSPPPGVVAVGEGAALDAALLLILLAELREEYFDSKAGSFLSVDLASTGSLGPKDLKPPMLRDWAWLGDAEKLDGLTSEPGGPVPLDGLECCDALGVFERFADEALSSTEAVGRGLGLGAFERMLAIFEALLALLKRNFTTFLPAFFNAGAAEAGVEPLRILGADAVLGLSRATGLPE